jgi:DNA polymerase (family 10)
VNNQEIVALLRQIAEMLEIKGEIVYKSIAYRRAADGIEASGQDIAEVWKTGKLRQIAGIGPAIAKKLDELLSTGQLEYFEKLKQEVPPSVTTLLQIPGVGPKTASLLWKELGLTAVEAVKKAAQEGQLHGLAGLGERSEQRILEGIEVMARGSERISLGVAWPVAQELIAALHAVAPGVSVEAAGSLRRMQSTIGDLDLLATSDAPEQLTELFTHLPQAAQVVAAGTTKASVILQNGLQVDLRAIEPKYWGAALQYFTGSQAHNVHLRELAQKQGLSLSEYGFKRGEGDIPCAEETEVYRTLGLQWIPPELREDRGEIEAARLGQLPNLAQRQDLCGDLHIHSNWSDGVNSLDELAQAAAEQGYEYLAISDHTQSLSIANGQSWERMLAQRQEMSRVQTHYPQLRLLQAAEVEIKADGKLDFPDEWLAQLDLVIASIHSGLRKEEEQITGRVVQAMRNPHVDIIGHPSGRLLGQREASAVNLETLIRIAAETGTILEINSMPNRLDLDDIHIRKAIEAGVKLAVNSDAHSTGGLQAILYGIATARRGWAQPQDIVNTWPLDKLLAFLRQKASAR